jgi:hypothetical protein
MTSPEALAGDGRIGGERIEDEGARRGRGFGLCKTVEEDARDMVVGGVLGIDAVDVEVEAKGTGDGRRGVVEGVGRRQGVDEEDEAEGCGGSDGREELETAAEA